MSETQTARVLLEVVAGIIPEKPEPELTRRWAITSEEWQIAGERDGGQTELLAVRNGQAQAYAALLMLQPERTNWVRTDWLWV